MESKAKQQTGEDQNRNQRALPRRILLFAVLVLGFSTALLNRPLERGLNGFRALFGGSSSPSDYVCDTKRFTTFLLSTDPLVIYIEGFVTVAEADHLISIAKFEPSTIGLDPRVRVPSDYRKSWSAELPDSPRDNFSDPVIECVVDRASAFQGFVSPLRMETLQLVKYGQGEFYDFHYDAFGNLNKTQGNRESSFFVTLRAKDIVGGATSFPRIPKPANPELCSRFLDCTGTQKGLLVKPKTGSAVFWRNLQSDHSIHPQTLHSGLKVNSGEKIGMNIWTWNKAFF
ncbi:hypothetical protein BC567DRAFT_196632 [Phyllosticta citribraziliensis]